MHSPVTPTLSGTFAFNFGYFEEKIKNIYPGDIESLDSDEFCPWLGIRTGCPSGVQHLAIKINLEHEQAIHRKKGIPRKAQGKFSNS